MNHKYLTSAIVLPLFHYGRNYKLLIIISILICCLCLPCGAQQRKFLQIEFNAGISEPVQDFKSPQMFSGRGFSAGGGFEFFFGKLGLGFNAGMFTNSSQKPFSDYIYNKFLEHTAAGKEKYWKTLFGMFGPVFKTGYKNLEFDLYVRGGYSQISVPELLFTKSFFNQTYEVYRFSGILNDWQFAWSSGARVIYKCNSWLGIQAKADYFTTSFLSKINYGNTFRDASDANRNGNLEDAEYFESQRVTNNGTTDLSVININLGLVFQLGKSKMPKIVQMIPEEAEIHEGDAVIEELQLPEGPVMTDTIKDVLVEDDLLIPAAEEVPIVNAHEAPVTEKANENEMQAEVVEIPPTTYDAPEARYDEEAAEFLYKAGESYFAINDFENAMPCFNKLKADPKYPRAKYMFALSLCAMGNCAEAKKEYRDFAKTYRGEDKRTLEIIFASHSERCKISGRLITVSPISDTKGKNKSHVVQDVKEEKATEGMTYKIQFIAMKKPNANFPRLVSIGSISTEFFPNKSVFRYTLGGYNDINGAATDVYKVRTMGFRDAFVAVYENGVRVNTLYHAK